ncbi:MAG: N-acetylmuramoyl-L-alanine amidase [Pseudotabrizicola sp.]|uniref:N-acetylmuramoyl-L-alanine amidase n=1 Tax=Pseudotabrizicola sp. TaxID=2939647 RepID=UPI00271C3FBD|nr:N-acetylmuramoyl-L-alanine amidase [Pseudotabrizicola sp.]MDO9640159.1 N-acetylmuramoyl-L-alanine amidase [Pseudotabrizicola sp.]
MSRLSSRSGEQQPSPNFGDRRGGVRPSLIVIHYTAMESCSAARARLCDPGAEVSAHWLISRHGGTEALVDEAQRAWHAGAGEWAGVTDVNSHSIGIELDNRGNHPFPAPQMAALEGLLVDIMARWSIPPQRVIGHSDMAPHRKSDPGPRFDWHRLARQGLSVWPGLTGDAAARDFVSHACRFGYPALAEDIVLRAFRWRFRPFATGPVTAADAAMAADLATRFGVDAPPAQA